MKKILSILVAICAYFAAVAQNPMVTLSHDGELTFFTNVGAFKSAVDAAQNGDILYLSQGDFTIPNGEITIGKRLSIVGNGYGSHIIGKINIQIETDPGVSMDAPLFDGLRLDDLHFHYNTVENLEEAEIRRCWIRYLDQGAYAATDVIYDKCYFEKVYFLGNGNVVVKNSKIIGGGTSDSLHNITAINCNILNPYYYPSASISCIIDYSGAGEPRKNGNHSIINSLLNFTPTALNVYITDIYTKEGTLLDEKANCSIDLKAAGYLGQDGETVVGIYGGGDYAKFSENPSVPSVDTDKSSVEYDSASNKLKVSITVKAD